AELTVTAPANSAPTATPQTVTTNEDTPVTIVLAGSDPDLGSSLSFVVVAQPTHGVLSGTAPNLTYSPAANYNGPDSFTFKVNDGAADSSTATVSISVTAVNDAPVANPVTVSTVSGQSTPLTLSGTDIDGNPLTFVILTSPAHGPLTGTGATRTYSSVAGFVGSDSFTYAATDGQSQSAPATVSITVTAAPGGLSLSVADDPSRTSNVRPLTGAVMRSGLSEYIFVGAARPSDVRQVTFTLDGTAFATDRTAPFDFADTSTRRPCRRCELDALPFESNLLTLGNHRITATALMRNGSRVVLDSTFTIADTTPHSLVVSATRDRALSAPLSGATLAGQRFIFLGPATDAIAGLRRVTFSLDGRSVSFDTAVPYDAFGARRGIPVALDTRRLRNGNHQMVATVELAGGGRVTYMSDFRVTN
ncbi:MAG TPA: cadherin-like domain-containing protein, partial [Ilumatobacteraceae bacterium]|nr:cadherin-like domain-containing protein [Ilumatobacteraceae bacterium]